MMNKHDINYKKIISWHQSLSVIASPWGEDFRGSILFPINVTISNNLREVSRRFILSVWELQKVPIPPSITIAPFAYLSHDEQAYSELLGQLNESLAKLNVDKLLQRWVAMIEHHTESYSDIFSVPSSTDVILLKLAMGDLTEVNIFSTVAPDKKSAIMIAVLRQHVDYLNLIRLLHMIESDILTDWDRQLFGKNGSMRGWLIITALILGQLKKWRSIIEILQGYDLNILDQNLENVIRDYAYPESEFTLTDIALRLSGEIFPLE